MNIIYKFVILNIVLLGTASYVTAQDRARTQFQEYSTGPGSFIQGIPVTKSPIKGTIYIYEDYQSSILLTNKKEQIEDVNLRYNVRDQKIEMRKDETDIQLNSKLIDSFLIVEDKTKFINAQSLSADQDHGLDGFLQIVADNENDLLLKRWYVNIKKANYNVALSAGTKYDEAILKEEFYILVNNDLIPFKGQNKEIRNYFSNNSDKLLQFKKENRLNFKNEEDYILFFKFLSKLL